MFLAAGCATSISRRIAFPSLVNLKDISVQFVQRLHQLHHEFNLVSTYKMPPIGSSIILRADFGPKHVRITSATAFAATIFEV